MPFIELQNQYDSVDARLVNLKKDLRGITDNSVPPVRVFSTQFRYDAGAGVNYPAGTQIQNLIDTVTISEPRRVATTSSRTTPARRTISTPAAVFSRLVFRLRSTTARASTARRWMTSFTSFSVDRSFGRRPTTKQLLVRLRASTLPSPLTKWAGCMTGRQAVSLEQVSNLDGTSKTFMYGENLGDVGNIWGYITGGIQPGVRPAAHSWCWGGVEHFGIVQLPMGNDATSRLQGSGPRSTWPLLEAVGRWSFVGCGSIRRGSPSRCEFRDGRCLGAYGSSWYHLAVVLRQWRLA